MTKEKLHEEYQQWIEEENKIAEDAFFHYKAQGSGLKAQLGSKAEGLRIKVRGRPNFIRMAAAAVLILTLGTTMWIKRDDIFKPKYTQEQIALSYEHAVKALAVCANSLSTEMNKLQKLDQIPKSIDNLKQLGNAINN